MGAEAPPRAAIYVRISRDFTGEGLGVARQRKDCLRIVTERGWELVEEYSDNSISASKREVRRPGYDKLIEDYDAGRFDALVCWDLDRLTRQPRQLEDWIDRAEQRGLALVTANGEADLTTDGGRMYARIKAAVARAEVERKSARQRSANEQRASEGKPWTGGPRPFGYTQDRLTEIPEEAELIRRAAREVLAGRPLLQVAREWTQLGAFSTHSARTGRWSANGVRGVLANPLYAGIRVHNGVEVARGEWPAILALEDHLALVHLFGQSSRVRGDVKAGRKATTLLTGIARCGKCGATARASSSRGVLTYKCSGGSCFAVPREPADTWAVAQLVAHLEAAQLAGEGEDAAALVAELEAEKEATSKRLDMAAKAFLEGQVGPEFVSRLEKQAAERIAELEEQIRNAGASSRASRVFEHADVRARVKGMSLYEQRELIEERLEVSILPRLHSRVKFNVEEHMRVRDRESASAGAVQA